MWAAAGTWNSVFGIEPHPLVEASGGVVIGLRQGGVASLHARNRPSTCEFGVLALSGLLRDAEHDADLTPRLAIATCCSYGFDESVVEAISLGGEPGDCLEFAGVDVDEVGFLDIFGPLFEVDCSLGSRRAHDIHHPFKNFIRARIA
jgi:hypothetical protein